MTFLPNRSVPLPEGTEAEYARWLGAIDEELSDPDCDRYDLCRRILTEIYFPQWIGVDPSELTGAARIALLQMDARHVTREPEYYAETDAEKYERVKPLLWLWERFDSSPLGENVHLGVLFRRILARHVFRRCGRNFKAFHQVKLSFGYNMEVGDDVVIHREVLLDDRGGIVIGDRASISDFANIYSHSHDVVDGRDVLTPQTVIGNDVRVTYHATVMSGVHLAENSMIGSFGMVTRDTEPNAVYVGIPAKKVREKPVREKHGPTQDPLAVE
jgi:galactoside O-acetyltransferase